MRRSEEKEARVASPYENRGSEENVADAITSVDRMCKMQDNSDNLLQRSKYSAGMCKGQDYDNLADSNPHLGAIKVRGSKQAGPAEGIGGELLATTGSVLADGSIAEGGYRGRNSKEDTEDEDDGEHADKKEKAVKLKKIFLRILKKAMEFPATSPLLRVWRDSRIAKQSGKEIPAGFYGIEVMNVAEVDKTLQKLLPEVDIGVIGSQNPLHTVADIIGIEHEDADKYIVLQKGRYVPYNARLPPEAKQRVQKLIE
eukprot:gene9658-11447_t